MTFQLNQQEGKLYERASVMLAFSIKPVNNTLNRMVMQMENLQVKINEKMMELNNRTKALDAGTGGSSDAGEYVTGVASGLVYQGPAIRITERIGDAEKVMEFATAEDYKVWKSLNP